MNQEVIERSLGKGGAFKKLGIYFLGHRDCQRWKAEWLELVPRGSVKGGRGVHTTGTWSFLS